METKIKVPLIFRDRGTDRPGGKSCLPDASTTRTNKTIPMTKNIDKIVFNVTAQECL
jgi:hypothetical protein